jgi:hypothetical protein
MTAAVIALAIFAQAPAKPIDEATFLREASKGWAVLEKAYADIEVKYRSESLPKQRYSDQVFARLGKRRLAQRGEYITRGEVPRNPDYVRYNLTDGISYFGMSKLNRIDPLRLGRFNPVISPEDESRFQLYEIQTRFACYAYPYRTWSEQVKQQGFVITSLQTVSVGTRELIRMEFLAEDRPDEENSVLKGWCLFDPKENYLPIESEYEIISNRFNTHFTVHLAVEHRASDAFPGLRLVPSRVTEVATSHKVPITTATIIYDFESFAPCKRKPADFRPEAFGLETPK